MDRDKEKMAERILHLTLEILFRLTGEDYTVVKKTSSERCRDPASEGWGKPQSPITGPPPHAMIHEDINAQKILELTYNMIELLTGEVPVRCQDVTIYFSMEEWDYLERHKDLYKDVIMEVPQPLTSSVLSSKSTTPERCLRPLLPQDCKQENPNDPQDHQGKDLTHFNTTETYLRDDEWCKVEISTDNWPDDCLRSSEELMMSSDFIADKPYTVHTEDLSSGPFEQLLPLDASQYVKKNKSKEVDHQRAHTVEKMFSCITCGKCFTDKSNLVKHERSHTGKKLFSCLECGSCFTKKSHLVRHQKIHTGERSFSCLECGKYFTQKSHLVTHMKIHSEDKPFSCSECGKCFKEKSKLVFHQRNHTGDKPFSCSECKKCFTFKSNLVIHQRIHTGEKPFSCSECGMCFTLKSNLVIHRRIHTGEKPFSCADCGKCFNQRPHLVRHMRIHTGEKPFSCSECGKCFIQRSHLDRHQRNHKGEIHFLFATDLC